jgi:single-strand DNA-binding protein
MANFNKVFLMGNLTKDPEVRYTPSNVAVATFSLAVNTTIGKDTDGNPRTETLFIDVTAFNKTAETIGKYCKKGSPLLIEGRLRLRTWEDKQNGTKHSKHEVLLERMQLLNGGSKKNENEEPPMEVVEDDVPF